MGNTQGDGKVRCVCLCVNHSVFVHWSPVLLYFPWSKAYSVFLCPGPDFCLCPLFTVPSPGPQKNQNKGGSVPIVLPKNDSSTLGTHCGAHGRTERGTREWKRVGGENGVGVGENWGGAGEAV